MPANDVQIVTRFTRVPMMGMPNAYNVLQVEVCLVTPHGGYEGGKGYLLDYRHPLRSRPWVEQAKKRRKK